MYNGKAVFAMRVDGDDASNIVNIVSQYYAPLLNRLGNPLTPAVEMEHTWVDKEIKLPDRGMINDPCPGEYVRVANGSVFRVGDIVMAGGLGAEVLGISSNLLCLNRAAEFHDGQTLFIDRNTKITNRFIKEVTNHNHVLGLTCAIAPCEGDELDYQEVIHELLNDLEGDVINGKDRMLGITQLIGFSHGKLTEDNLDRVIKNIRDRSQGRTDIILAEDIRMFERFCKVEDNLFYSHEGTHEIVVSQNMPPNTFIVLDSGRINVRPYKGHSFNYRDGAVSGRYVLELRNQECHGGLRD